MIENPKIRPTVLSLLTSLQKTHEGVTTDIDYYSASVVGLNVYVMSLAWLICQP